MTRQEAAEAWVRSQIDPTGPAELVRQRPWSTVLRVPVRDGVTWLKTCSAVQAFEPRLTGQLFARWPDRVTEVLAYDEAQAWLLTADAGAPLRELGNPPERWLEILPLYAELQRGEADKAHDHIAHGVPSLPLEDLPRRYAQLVDEQLPLEPGELARLRAFAPRFERLCRELAGESLPATVQHDDLHPGSVYQRDGRLRLLDWGDTSISHPFFSLVVTFRSLEDHTGLAADDPWFVRLREAYLEPWGQGLGAVFDLAIRVGHFAHTIGWARHREFLTPPWRTTFDTWFARILRRALELT